MMEFKQEPSDHVLVDGESCFRFKCCVNGCHTSWQSEPSKVALQPDGWDVAWDSFQFCPKHVHIKREHDAAASEWFARRLAFRTGLDDWQSDWLAGNPIPGDPHLIDAWATERHARMREYHERSHAWLVENPRPVPVWQEGR